MDKEEFSMMKKIMITGTGGFLGSHLAAGLEEKYTLIKCSHQTMDICDETVVKGLLEKERPDYVLHCAAIADTKYAQSHPEESYAINVLGTENLAKACSEWNAKLIYMSSDQVYHAATHLEPQKESDYIAPTTVYGLDKRRAEERVTDILPDAVGLRLTWMYDMPHPQCKTSSNLLCNIIKARLKAQPLSMPVGDYRGVTYVWEVVRQMEKIMELPGGIYNCGSDEASNIYEIGLFAAEHMGIDKPDEWIIPDYSKFAEHTRNMRLNTEKINQYGISFSASTEGICKCLQEYDFKK